MPENQKLATITFDRSILYTTHNGQLIDMPLVKLLGIISETIATPNRQHTLTALQEYGITVHEHYVHADGTNMFGPIPSAETEIK